MGLFKKIFDSMGRRLFSSFPYLSSLWAKTCSLQDTDDIPWTTLTKPLSNCTLALVTTAGIHHTHQPPFNMDDPEGDPTFRNLDLTTLKQGYTVTHDYYNSSDVLHDINIVLPIDRAQELVSEGKIGRLHPTGYSLMGHILRRHIPTLRKETAPAIAHQLAADRVDIVLLTPA